MDGVLEILLLVVFVVGEVLVTGADWVVQGLRMWLFLALSGAAVVLAVLVGSTLYQWLLKVFDRWL